MMAEDVAVLWTCNVVLLFKHLLLLPPSVCRLIDCLRPPGSCIAANSGIELWTSRTLDGPARCVPEGPCGLLLLQALIFVGSIAGRTLANPPTVLLNLYYSQQSRGVRGNLTYSPDALSAVVRRSDRCSAIVSLYYELECLHSLTLAQARQPMWCFTRR